MSKNHYIIGAGGVGSWLTPSLCLLVGEKNVTVIDGDALEEKNLNRQLFDDDQIGENKAQSMNTKYGCAYMTDFYSLGDVQHKPSDWIFCCVDNNAGRMAVLRACDMFGCKAIFAANETTSSEAYVYLPQWLSTPLDPRIFYPEMVADHEGDPMRPAGCTGEAQNQNPQLVSANFSAAALAQNLYILWGMKSAGITKETLAMMPHHYRANISRLEVLRIENKLERKVKNEQANISPSGR